VKIQRLEVDRFGVWSGLELPGLDDRLTVVYGPNEAGKTTLLEFLRSVFYGFSPARRAYLPAPGKPPAGGSVEVSSVQGRFHIARHDTDPEAHPQGELILTAADGTRHGEHYLKVLLADTDETIFDNVFAISLREMQELSTLGDTEAAALLYNLSLGLDRVSLVDVIGALATSREGILSTDDRPCQAAQLLAERDRLRAEIEELQEGGRRYGRLAGERARLEQQIARVEHDLAQARTHARTLEIALAVGPRWRQRIQVEQQLAAMGPAASTAPVLVARLDRLNEKLDRARREIEGMQKRCAELAAERAALSVNKPLWQQASRIEALGLQESWIASLDEQIVALELEIDATRKEQTAELARFGLEGQTLPELSGRAMAALRSAARAVRHASGETAQLGTRAEAARQNAQALAEQLEKSLAAHGERELPAALDRRAAELSLLRRRVQADERLEELTRHRDELDEQGRELLERQMWPLWAILALGGVFMCGVVLLAAGMLIPATFTTAPGWALAVLGLGGAGGAAVMKLLLDRSHSQALESCQRQSEMLQLQLKQAKEERDELDRQIPRGGGPLAARIQKVEQQLADLEELVPLESQCRAAQEEATLAERQSSNAENERSAARRRWREALAAAHLPEKFTPRQLHVWIRHGDRVAQIGRRVAQREEELAQRRSELNGFAAKVLQLLVDTGLETNLDDPLAQLRLLRDAWAVQDERMRKRAELRRQIAKLTRRQSHREETVRQLQQRRRSLLRRAGVRREQELRELALQAARAESLRKEFDTLNREIAAAIGEHCAEERIGQQLESQSAAQSESALHELRERIAVLDRQLQEHFERRGQLHEQLKTLADDRRLGQRRMDLSMVEKRLADVLRRWQVLATTSQALDRVRAVYERDRQPQTLQEASGYLERLTDGRYRRVWTPLGEHALRVDDEHGDWRSVDRLSRGTREQLLLALRLSLAAAYARRGAALPMVLDDVLVNFDTHRAQSAAAVLRDFAAAGHQLLVFTCHEHILRMFQTLDVPALELGNVRKKCVLPACPEPAHSEAARPEPARAEPARRRRARKTPKPEEAPERIVAVEATPSEEPLVIAPPTPPEDAVVVADPVAFEEELPEAIVADPSPLAVEEEDALEDSPWEETSDDEDDIQGGGGTVEAA
jgi:uncharacterized protein YhaN